jgi:hypothetical protein
VLSFGSIADLDEVVIDEKYGCIRGASRSGLDPYP